MDNYQKPPLGLLPRSLYEEQKQQERFEAVCAAISSYYNDCRPIDISWIVEYNELCGKEKTRVMSNRNPEPQREIVSLSIMDFKSDNPNHRH